MPDHRPGSSRYRARPRPCLWPQVSYPCRGSGRTLPGSGTWRDGAGAAPPPCAATGRTCLPLLAAALSGVISARPGASRSPWPRRGGGVRTPMPGQAQPGWVGAPQLWGPRWDTSQAGNPPSRVCAGETNGPAGVASCRALAPGPAVPVPSRWGSPGLCQVGGHAGGSSQGCSLSSMFLSKNLYNTYFLKRWNEGSVTSWAHTVAPGWVRGRWMTGNLRAVRGGHGGAARPTHQAPHAGPGAGAAPRARREGVSRGGRPCSPGQPAELLSGGVGEGRLCMCACAHS